MTLGAGDPLGGSRVEGGVSWSGLWLAVGSSYPKLLGQGAKPEGTSAGRTPKAFSLSDLLSPARHPPVSLDMT